MKSVFKYILFGTFLVCSGLFLSCGEDFLYKEPIGVAAGSVIESPEGVEAVLIATYAAIRGISMFGGALGTDWTFGSGNSDDCYVGWYAGSNHGPYDTYNIRYVSPGYLQGRWRDCYQGVAQANRTGVLKQDSSYLNFNYYYY